MTIHEVDLESGVFECLSDAVRDIFPLLWFEPEQTEAFLQSLRDGKLVERIVVVESATSRAFVGENHGRLAFVIPADWHRRYQIVDESIKELQAQGERKYMLMDIGEEVPSHCAYFAGLLPGLGFHMEPRVEMVADRDAVDDIAPALPAGFTEVTLTPDRAAQAAMALHEAYLTVHPEWPPERRAKEQESWSRSMEYASPAELRDEWIAVEREGAIVGVCAVNNRADAMIISELAVLPEHFRKGLGRYLLTRGMQNLSKSGPPDRNYLLSARRRKETRASIALYRSVGFTVEKVFTRAAWYR